MAKSKRDEEAKKEEGDYEFKLPAFDERAFMRREVQNARASFYTLGLGVGAGALSVVLYAAALPWQYGWLPILGSLVLLKPFLQKMGFGEDVTGWKPLLGSLFMVFFTAFSVWILGVNMV